MIFINFFPVRQIMVPPQTPIPGQNQLFKTTILWGHFKSGPSFNCYFKGNKLEILN
jgi:hypothetical protein